MTVEDQLRDALRRKEAPPGFAARLAARATGEQASAVPPVHVAYPAGHPPPAVIASAVGSRARWVALGMAASLVLATGSGLVFLDREKDSEARRARALAIEAFRVANVELSHIQSRIAARVDRPQAERE